MKELKKYILGALAIAALGVVLVLAGEQAGVLGAGISKGMGRIIRLDFGF